MPAHASAVFRSPRNSSHTFDVPGMKSMGFVFFGRRRDALKVLFFDGTGMCIFYKRLDRGTFQVPAATSSSARHIEVDDVALEALLDGIDVDEAATATRPRRTH
jgi:transposase